MNLILWLLGLEDLFMEKKMVVPRPETKCLGEVEDGHYGHAIQG